VNRRNFIRLLAGAGVAAASGNLLEHGILFQGLPPPPVVTLTRPMMGSSVSISILDADGVRANMAIEVALAKMQHLEGILSRYRAGSPLFELNRSGLLPEAPIELLDVLQRALFFSDLSDGSFDVTVEPIVDLVARSFAVDAGPPSEGQIESALREVNYHDVGVYGSTIRLSKGMGITLDGIAKGYIVDGAIEALRRQGYDRALVEAGGDIRALGDKGRNRGWRIGIRDPLGRQDLIRVMEVTDRAVATSGDYEIFFDAGKKYFHIVNPKDGRSPQEIHSATVVASNAMDADALGTTIMVLGSGKGLDLIEKIEGAECFLVLRDGRTVESSGMKDFW
jgi:thiamine biosynthesis lipoprotein